MINLQRIIQGIIKTSFKISNGSSEAVNRRTHNIMSKRKETKKVEGIKVVPRSRKSMADDTMGKRKNDKKKKRDRQSEGVN